MYILSLRIQQHGIWPEQIHVLQKYMCNELAVRAVVINSAMLRSSAWKRMLNKCMHFGHANNFEKGSDRLIPKPCVNM